MLKKGGAGQHRMLYQLIPDQTTKSVGSICHIRRKERQLAVPSYLSFFHKKRKIQISPVSDITAKEGNVGKGEDAGSFFLACIVRYPR